MADRFALIIDGLCQAVARRGGGLSRLAGPLIVLIWTRLRRIATRFTRAIAAPPPSGRRAVSTVKRPPRPRQPHPHPLPRRKAWLLRLAPETASAASQLRYFLADPEVASLLAAAPQLHRILRPLCHMLGVRPGRALPPPLPPPLPSPGAVPDAPSIPSQAAPQAAPAALPPAAFPAWPPQPLGAAPPALA